MERSVQKLVRAADMAARGMDDGCLSQQVLAKEAGRGREAVLADESLNTGECVNGYCRLRAVCCYDSKASSFCSLARQC